MNRQINDEVLKWIDKWKKGKKNIPTLRVTKCDEQFFIEDTRFGDLVREQITIEQAKISLFGLTDRNKDSISWGTGKKVICYYEGKYIPLATAHPAIFKELSNE